jgi:hypothetical protein
MKINKRRRNYIILAIFVAVLALVWPALLVAPGGTGTKAALIFGKPERRIEIRQQANYSAEPYTTSAVYLDAAGKWWIAQLDFQDVRWLGTCELIEDQVSGNVQVMRCGSQFAEISFNPLEAKLKGGNRIAFELIKAEDLD